MEIVLNFVVQPVGWEGSVTVDWPAPQGPVGKVYATMEKVDGSWRPAIHFGPWGQDATVRVVTGATHQDAVNSARELGII